MLKLDDDMDQIKVRKEIQDYNKNNELEESKKDFQEIKMVHKLIANDYDPKEKSMSNKLDRYFIKVILIPYLSSIFTSLQAKFGHNKDYLNIEKTKKYVNLPELLGSRMVHQINANGDERIDHDEFINFFVTLFMGKRK